MTHSILGKYFFELTIFGSVYELKQNEKVNNIC